MWIEERSRLDQAYDYIQSSVPTPSPTCTYTSWLRTSDVKEFLWLQGDGYWVATGGPSHTTWSSEPGGPLIDNRQMKFHEIFTNQNDRQWYPPFDCAITAAWLKSRVDPTAEWIVEFRRNGSVLATLAYGTGSNSVQWNPFYPVDVGQGITVYSVQTFIPPVTSPPDNVSCGMHYVERVQP